jgi:hypothetical protein
MVERLKENRRIIFLVIVVIIVLIVIGWMAYPRYVKGLLWADRTGFEPITVWNILDLIIVPALLAIGAYWLNLQQKERETEREKKRRDEAERIETDRQQQETLQKYLDDMSGLVLDKEMRKELLESEEESAVRDVAQIRTVTAIRALDTKRINTLVHFLSNQAKITSRKCSILTVKRGWQQ